MNSIIFNFSFPRIKRESLNPLWSDYAPIWCLKKLDYLSVDFVLEKAWLPFRWFCVQQLIKGKRTCLDNDNFIILFSSRCGYDQQGAGANSPSPTDGILGLGSGAASIVSQLRDQGVTKNVIGHCLSRRGGGYLFFGDDLVPPRGMTWAPMSRIPPSWEIITVMLSFSAGLVCAFCVLLTLLRFRNYYSPGKAGFFFNKQSLRIKEEPVVFDSGSSYTYFTNKPYEAFLTAVKHPVNSLC